MSKSAYYFGQSILGQVLRLIPSKIIRHSVKKTRSDFSVKKFNTSAHLKTMCYAVLADVTGLRHVSDGLMAMGSKLPHIGIDYVAPKSTLSDSNAKRTNEVFGLIYQGLYSHYQHFFSDSSTVAPLLKHAYAIDSTSISLFKNILKASGRKSKDGIERGGIKSHMQVRLLDEMPIHIQYTAGASNDHDFLKDVVLQKHDIAIFDKAYVDYKQYAKWSSEDIYFVTREKDSAKSTPVKERDLPDDKNFDILIDEEVLKTYNNSENKPQNMLLRRVAIYSEKHKATIVLLTNMFHLQASEISLLYRKRWRIELLFKQLKQNYPLKYFMGDNENAIKIQIWCCLIVNLLITVIKLKASKNKMSYALIVSVIRQHLMSYIHLINYLNNPNGLRIAFKKCPKSKHEDDTQTTIFTNTT